MAGADWVVERSAGDHQAVDGLRTIKRREVNFTIVTIEGDLSLLLIRAEVCDARDPGCGADICDDDPVRRLSRSVRCALNDASRKPAAFRDVGPWLFGRREKRMRRGQRQVRKRIVREEQLRTIAGIDLPRVLVD